MAQKYTPESIPENRQQVLSLLRALDDDPSRLTARQREAIYRLYRLDGDNRTVEQLIQDGEL